jgi:hypothetical protein
VLGQGGSVELDRRLRADEPVQAPGATLDELGQLVLEHEVFPSRGTKHDLHVHVGREVLEERSYGA